MGVDKTPSLIPLQAFTLRPTPVRGSWLHWPPSGIVNYKRIYSVFEAGKEPVEDTLDWTPLFYVDINANARIPVWPFDGTHTIAIYNGDTNLADIRNRGVEPLARVTQWHSIVQRFACSIGRIQLQDRETVDKNKKPLEFTLSSGLGHGRWEDSGLEKDLGLVPEDTELQEAPSKLKWKATGNSWVFGQSGPQLKDWNGGVHGGGLKLAVGEKTLAIYKPRSATWKSPKNFNHNGKDRGG
ncbi:hypothetical protein BS50DRAFT_583878 [Corynespora cassiicola Philippines]|uniref:Uncharacterized protein n=1 Tax=Corynespora cassiicola Philippines TaxID=1448308 RepID=A0A2T2P3T1_CORCC|nr:hypothetical protein BS50DRAFT_583878 [Corynespora cassiicola Philippines]